MVDGISKQTLQRLPHLLTYLKSLDPVKNEFISSTTIALALGMNPVKVRKDLATVAVGVPRKGFETKKLIYDIENFLGYNNTDSAVIVGAGRLGRALLGYKGFTDYGVDIVAAFDVNPELYGDEEENRRVLPMEKLPSLVKRMGIKIAILTVPSESAQSVAELLVNSGIKAILNFAPCHLALPKNIIVQNENLAPVLALLTKRLEKQLEEEENAPSDEVLSQNLGLKSIQ